MAERRFYLRVPIEVPVVLTGGGLRVEGRATGLSCGGMAVEAAGLRTGQVLAVAMVLPGTATPTVADARVVHATGRSAGLAFVRVHPRDAQSIEQYVWDSLCPPETPSRPAAATPAERRPAGVLRVPVDAPVTITRRSGAVEARATGLSAAGLAVRGVELEEGERVDVALDLPGAPAPIRAPGLVARLGRGIAGVRFVGLSQQDLRELEGLLWSYLRAAVRGPQVVEETRARPDRTENILAAIDEVTAQQALAAEQRTCEIPGCDRPHKARGLCALHYSRWRRTRR